jgi:hypothetical protein
MATVKHRAVPLRNCDSRFNPRCLQDRCKQQTVRLVVGHAKASPRQIVSCVTLATEPFGLWHVPLVSGSLSGDHAERTGG